MTILGFAQAVYADWPQRTGARILRWSLVFLLIFFCALKSTTAEAHEIAPFISHDPFLRWVNVGFGPQGAPEAIGIFAMITGLLLAAGNGAFSPSSARGLHHHDNIARESDSSRCAAMHCVRQ
jgi:Protein of unknown function, DUF417